MHSQEALPEHSLIAACASLAPFHTHPSGARNNFTIHIERLQYACPCLEELGLNGLGGCWGWAFNRTSPAAMPWYLPTESIGLAATAEAALASLEDGSHKRQQQQGSGRAGPAVPTGAQVAAAVAAAAAAAAAGAGSGDAEGPSGAASGSGGLRLLYHSASFPRLRVCEVGTTVSHSEGQLSGRSLIHGGALKRCALVPLPGPPPWLQQGPPQSSIVWPVTAALSKMLFVGLACITARSCSLQLQFTFHVP